MDSWSVGWWWEPNMVIGGQVTCGASVLRGAVVACRHADCGETVTVWRDTGDGWDQVKPGLRDSRDVSSPHRYSDSPKRGLCLAFTCKSLGRDRIVEWCGVLQTSMRERESGSRIHSPLPDETSPPPPQHPQLSSAANLAPRKAPWAGYIKIQSHPPLPHIIHSSTTVKVASRIYPDLILKLPCFHFSTFLPRYFPPASSLLPRHSPPRRSISYTARCHSDSPQKHTTKPSSSANRICPKPAPDSIPRDYSLANRYVSRPTDTSPLHLPPHRTSEQKDPTNADHVTFNCRQISINIIAPDHALDQEIITLDLPPGLTLADLKGTIHADTGLLTGDQQFYLNNHMLQGDDKTLEEVGINHGDMVALLMRQPEPSIDSELRDDSPRTRPAQQRGSRDPQQGRRQQQRSRGNTDPHEIETTRLSILGNPQAMSQVRSQKPALADAINDPDRFRQVWMEMMMEDEERERERLEQMRLLNEDPFNIDAQRKIEEMIRQQQVQENLQAAYENNPEVFGRVHMLYIPVLVNKHPVKAFVDSGAQTTIMSPSCAEACGIMRLIDRRYSGVAKGVGTAQILGRVHSAEIRIGTAVMTCSFTVMEGKDVDLLLGLDMLKRFQAVIDLRVNKLIFGDGNEVDFLGEADIPKNVEEAQQAEPTIAGPGNTEIGAQSGTVKPAGTSAAAAASSSSSSSAPSAGRANFQGTGQTLGGGGGGGASSNSKAPVVNNPGAPTPAAAPARGESRSTTAAATSYSNESIAQLQNLGFSRQQAIAALDACGGNVEYAAGLLFQS
nr:dna damage-inducible protein 1 [Quercus suber]